MTFIKKFYQKCPICGNIGFSSRKEEKDKELYLFECPSCECIKNDEEAKALFEDAYSLYLKSIRKDGKKCK